MIGLVHLIVRAVLLTSRVWPCMANILYTIHTGDRTIAPPRPGIGLDCRLLCSVITDVPAKNIPNLCIVVPDTGLAIDFPPPRALHTISACGSVNFTAVTQYIRLLLRRVRVDLDWKSTATTSKLCRISVHTFIQF